MGDRRVACRMLVGRPEERDYLEDLGLGGRKILKWIFRKWDGQGWIGLIRLRIGKGGRCL